MENLTKKYLNTIDITSIEVLYKKLYLLLDKYKIKNDDIYEYAIIHKNFHILNSLEKKKLEQFLEEYYPQILEINGNLEVELSSSSFFITDNKILLEYKYYSIKELSNLILNHNKNVVKSSPNQYLLEKEKLID
jgi:hypothetical protein